MLSRSTTDERAQNAREMRRVGVQTRTLAVVAAVAAASAPSIFGREDAELVALRVGKHHPRLLALTDVDMLGAQTDHAVDLGLLIVGSKVEVNAILDHLVVGHRDEQPVRSEEHTSELQSQF